MDISDLAAAQGGVVTRAQAERAGIPERQLGTPSRPRRLVRVRQGVYAEAGTWEQADDAGRTALAVAAERLVSKVDLVAAGPTAAVLHGLPLLGRPPSRPVLVEGKSLRPRHHGGSRSNVAHDRTIVRDVPVTSLERTAIDVARVRGFAAGVVTADAVLARGVPTAALERVVTESRRWPGTATASKVARFADARSESALESLGRARFCEHGLPTPDLQVVLSDALGVIGRVDQYWERYRAVAEADGALKYDEPGALFAEKVREDRLREAGFEVVRYTWDEVLRCPEVVVNRVLRALRRGEGRRRPHLP